MSNFKSELSELKRYQAIPRELLQDSSLSVQARFIYCYMAAKPEGWEFWQEVMCKELKMSRETLRKYLHELEGAGWLDIGTQNVTKGQFGAVQYTLKSGTVPNSTVAENFRDGELPLRKSPVAEKSGNIDSIDTGDNTDSQENIDTTPVKKESVKKENSPAAVPATLPQDVADVYVPDDLKARAKRFYDSLVPYVIGHGGQYDRAMVREFYEYWTEPDRAPKPKMRFEKQATWEVGRRLATWARRNGGGSYGGGGSRGGYSRGTSVSDFVGSVMGDFSPEVLAEASARIGAGPVPVPEVLDVERLTGGGA